ncbi:hypothetical protein JKP88DRAFT_282371 [Tribonema minus]|uniref:Uncharacterized protein n=1 Tax=Tribonema minus TaxID=303371 RepID=A0A835YKT2_9STRA|nr:hypothetical protein JKP88DRAFT_282371 [Tribonema minus]
MLPVPLLKGEPARLRRSLFMRRARCFRHWLTVDLLSVSMLGLRGIPCASMLTSIRMASDELSSSTVRLRRCVLSHYLKSASLRMNGTSNLSAAAQMALTLFTLQKLS